MSELKEMVLDVVEKIYKNQVKKETVDLLEEGKWAESVWKLLKENELINIAVAEEKGGAGGDIEDLCYLYRLIGLYAVPIPFVEHTLANFLLNELNITQQQSLTTYKLSDKPLNIKGGQISGEIQYVPWGRYSKQVLVFAEDNHKEGFALVDLSENCQVQATTNIASEPRDTILLNGAKVKNFVYAEQYKLQQFKKYISAANISKMTGAINKAFDLTVRFSKEREQFGRPIHRFQLIQQHLAILAGEQALVDAAFKNMVEVLVNQTEKFEVALSRLRIDVATKIVAATAHQVHAAIGVTHEHSLHQFTRRLWSWRDEDYTTKYWNSFLVKNVMTDPNDIWVIITEAKQKSKKISLI